MKNVWRKSVQDRFTFSPPSFLSTERDLATIEKKFGGPKRLWVLVEQRTCGVTERKRNLDKPISSLFFCKANRVTLRKVADSPFSAGFLCPVSEFFFWKKLQIGAKFKFGEGKQMPCPTESATNPPHWWDASLTPPHDRESGKRKRNASTFHPKIEKKTVMFKTNPPLLWR